MEEEFLSPQEAKDGLELTNLEDEKSKDKKKESTKEAT